MPGWIQSVLYPAGPQSGRIYALWRFMLPVSIVVFLVVIALLSYAALHRRRQGELLLEGAPGERRMGNAVAIGTAATVIILVVFLVFDFATGRAMTAAPQPAVSIHVIGHQWWWEAEYYNAVANKRLTTANEIHIPVGQPVLLRLSSPDVIHSFWVPELNGKRDLIPGKESSIWLQADSAGVYRGQCAEFCGMQHAKMAFIIVADRPADFQRWYAAQSDTAAAPTDSSAAHGQEVFFTSPCVMCHTIQGTPAGGKAGPDLTHVASRRYIAASSLPNTRGNLAGWIVDPQAIKPGAQMPPNSLRPQDLQALLDYLGTLK